MIRYLDFNDGYTTLESGHPSDSIAATLAGAEMAGAGGRRFLTATAVAYEAFCRFGDAFNIRALGVRPRYQRGHRQLRGRGPGHGPVGHPD